MSQGIHGFMFSIFDLLLISVNVFMFVLPSYNAFVSSYNNENYLCFQELIITSEPTTTIPTLMPTTTVPTLMPSKSPVQLFETTFAAIRTTEFTKNIIQSTKPMATSGSNNIIVAVIPVVSIIAFICIIFLCLFCRYRYKQMMSDPDYDAVQRELEQVKRKEKDVKKVLILASGCMGRATLFRQLTAIHKGTYNCIEERKYYIDWIHEQIINHMKHLIEGIEEVMWDAKYEEYGDEYFNQNVFDPFVSFSSDTQNAIAVLNSLNNCKLSEAAANAVKVLWQENSIREFFNTTSNIELCESSAFFWDNIDRISQHDYVPDVRDIMLVRHRTTGVLDQRFEFQSRSYCVQTVGGQLNERKKWIHRFECVTAVIFVVSLNCYDKTLFEDETQNAMVDAIYLFEKICNHQYFVDTNMILFLNKKDLFAKKILTIPISVCPEFDDFDGNVRSYDETSAYIRDKLLAQNKNPMRQVYVHFTCMLDTNQIEKVWRDVDFIVSSSYNNGLI
eukprot:519335_1